jgi:hypothetical protein
MRLVVPSLSIDGISSTPKSEEGDGILPTISSTFKLHNNNNNNNKTSVPVLPSNNHSHPNFLVNFPLCLVHVGKAAGSSVSCGLGLIYANCEGMPRDKLPRTHFFHMRRNNCPSDTQTYLVTLRNPLTRLQSWFDFEKNIVPSRKNKQEEEQLKRKRGMLFTDCYSNFSDLVTVGLRPLIPRTTVAAKPDNMTCPERAWAAVLGVRAFSYHEWYNYEHYWNGMHTHAGFENRSSLHVLRTEHLMEDWSTISTEQLFRPVNRGKSTRDPWQALSKEAVENLCRALCPEIQMYKRILTLADNANESQVRASVEEVQALCPSETLQVRACPGIPTFPLLKVSRRQYQTETKKRLFEMMSKKKKT